jgi:hypothetical protein
VSQQELLQQYPLRRLKSYDGMAITSDVWEAAHHHDRQQLRYHSLLQHGAGIALGLEVIASDPPDSAVYIQPGIAIDALGNVIVVTEAFAFDLGAAQGPLYLLLSYHESQPLPDETAAAARSDDADVLLFVHAQYSLEAAAKAPPANGPFVELARVDRRGLEPISNAGDPAQPRPNQIDLRFRPEARANRQQPAQLGLCHLGDMTYGNRHAHGLQRLAEALRHNGHPAWVNDGLTLTPTSDLSGYTLVNVVASGEVKLTADEMNVLYNYLQGGGTLLLEVCQHGPQSDLAEAALRDMLDSFGVKVAEIPDGHALLAEPYFFARPPAGYVVDGTPSFKVGEGVIFSLNDYGCLWQGERTGRPASREEIRAAHEWGANMVAYALKRCGRSG